MTSKYTSSLTLSSSNIHNGAGNNNLNKKGSSNTGNNFNQNQNSNNGIHSHNQTNKNSFIPQAQKTKFQSQDSEGSDISYESSIQSEEDINIGRIQFFKQQMSRFFINYPQLINHDIIETDNPNIQYQNFMNGYIGNNKQQYSQNKNKEVNFKSFKNAKSQNLNKNWVMIADQILNEAKQSSSFLQDLSRRIALYRSKVQQQDLIDILLKEQKNIMKEIDLQINQKKKEIKGNKNTQNIQGVQNMYFSWRKKKQIQNRINLVKDQNISSRKKSSSNEIKKSSKSPKKSNRSLHKTKTTKLNLSRSKSQQKDKKISGTFFITSNLQEYDLKDSINVQNQNENNQKRSNQRQITRQFQQRLSVNMKSLSPSKNKKRNATLHTNSILKQNQFLDSSAGLEKQNKSIGNHGQTQNLWKHLINFQPKTEAGRQLCQLIRKTNTPNDQLGIKKTIMTFLSRSKDMVQNQIVLKSTISQKIQKLYNDDSKELLMFYPTRLSSQLNNSNGSVNNSNNNKQHSSNGGSDPKDENINIANSNANKFQNFGKQSFGIDQNNKFFQQGQKFIKVLQDIVQGPLMKYWMSIQQNKL